MADVNVEPLVGDWETWYKGEVEPDTVSHAKAHIRWLVPPRWMRKDH